MQFVLIEIQGCWFEALGILGPSCMRCIVCLLKRNLLTADDLGHYTVSGKNGEVLDDEPGLFAERYLYNIRILDKAQVHYARKSG